MNFMIPTESCSYRVEKHLDSGTYGKVVLCRKSDTEEAVAVKMVRKCHAKVLKNEYKTLRKLGQLDPDRNNLVRFIERFEYEDHVCFAFEALDQNLLDFIRDRNFRPLLVSEIRIIAKQMLVALNLLKSQKIVHTDIKFDNIMLVNHKLQPFKVKLIDFGLSRESSTLMKGTLLQAVGYRAPEVMLGFPLDESIDMWSLGCILAGLYLGRGLFSAFTDYEVMRTIVRLQGLPPEHLIEGGLYQKNFFTPVHSPAGRIWRLKSAQEFYGKVYFRERHCKSICDNIRSLGELEWMHQIPDDPTDCKAFIDLLKMMLHVDPAKRITPSDALKHDFITNLLPESNNPDGTQPQSSMRESQLEKASSFKDDNENTGKMIPIQKETGSKIQKNKSDELSTKSRTTQNRDSLTSGEVQDPSHNTEVKCTKRCSKRIGNFFSRIYRRFT